MRRLWKGAKHFTVATLAITLGSPAILANDGYAKRGAQGFSYPDPTVLSPQATISDAGRNMGATTRSMASGSVNRYQGEYYTSSPSNGAAISGPVTPIPSGEVSFQAEDHFSGHAMPSGDMPADCCMGCDRRFYARAEALWLERNGDANFSMAQTNTLGQFGFDVNGRYTIGQMFDCTDGVEFTFTGPMDWTRNGPTLVGANLGSNLTTVAPYNASDLDAFNLATVQTQEHRAKFLSYEFNRRWWAWDAISTLAGVKAIQYNEQFIFNTDSPVGVGLHATQTKNYMVGFQLGADFFYPYTHRLSFGSKVRAGVYGNFNRSRTLVTKGARILAAQNLTEDFDISGLLEAGSFMRYSIRSNMVATAGYEIWYMPGVATIADQRYLTISPGTGSSVYATDDIFFHGATAGLELSF